MSGATAINDPALKKLEIKNNPMEGKSNEIIFPKSARSSKVSTKFKIRKQHKKEEDGWSFLHNIESASNLS
jgi:hypothetical protein